MGKLTSVSQMVTQCQTRVPIGLSSSFWEKKLNEAYRWISQKGNYIWDLKGVDVVVGAGQSSFDIPSDCDPGKPMYLVGPIASPALYSLDSLVPYVAWDDAALQKISELPAMAGLVSCWTFRTNFSVSASPPYTPSYLYTGYLFPTGTIAVSSVFRVVYHVDVSSVEYASVPTLTAPNYFPTPNSFDNLLIELAEAEARRIYGLAGWDIIQKRAESAIANLLDSYRSTKNSLAGITDQQKQVSEKKMMAQENS